MISNVVRLRDYDGLKTISQQCLFNMWCDFVLCGHNKLGIHGLLVPWKCLHWIQLGWCKHSRSTIFEQFGPDSELSRIINTFATQMGHLFQPQSQKGYPRTKFSKGVQRGALMAHEMSGAMLFLAATLRSKQGRDETLRAKNSNFPNQQSTLSWLSVLESQLQFEFWLKETANVSGYGNSPAHQRFVS